MDFRNRLGLYGSYFLGMAGIGFTLPYLPLYLSERGISDRWIGLLSTLAALSAMGQFPIGRWSDRIHHRKLFLLAALGLVALSTLGLPLARGPLAIGLMVILFAENGICRSVVEMLSGAEAVSLAKPGQIGAALGALRFWKPIGIMCVAALGGWLAEQYGVGSILSLLAVTQGLAFATAFLIHEPSKEKPREETASPPSTGWLPRDRSLWAFIGAMVLFHMANSPGGVYLGLFLNRDLQAPPWTLALAFVVSMATWMIVVWPCGRLADQWGRRPLLIAGWGIMTLRLMLTALARESWQVVACEVLDGMGNGLFAVVAAAWVTDRLAESSRAGEAQAIVGTSLVLGSAIGPAIAGLLVDSLGYRGIFALLSGIGGLATLMVAALVPETVGTNLERSAGAELASEPLAS
jgi:MFS family permease